MEIKFQNVEYSYSKQGKKVIDEINIKIASNRITGIIGPSGSGKTTLAEMICGYLIPTKGKIIVGENIISSKKFDNTKTRVALVGQIPEKQFFCDSVEKELLTASEQYKVEKPESKIKEVLELVGLEESILNIDPFSLSNSETRLVQLASALIYDPSILILDEPTIGLDMASRKMLITLLTTLKARYKKTIIIIGHDVNFINKITDDVIILNNGRNIKSGHKLDVFKEEEFLMKNGVEIPKIIEFENYVLKHKNIYLGYRTEINDLVKDILRHIN